VCMCSVVHMPHLGKGGTLNKSIVFIPSWITLHYPLTCSGTNTGYSSKTLTLVQKPTLLELLQKKQLQDVKVLEL